MVAAYAMARGVTAFILIFAATALRAVFLFLLDRWVFEGRSPLFSVPSACSSARTIEFAELGEVKMCLKAYNKR